MTQVYNSAGVPIISQVTGVSLGSINVSAGTTSNNLTNLVFSNGGNVTFGLSGSTVTASAAGGGGGGLTNINVSAGTTSNNLSNIVFSNGGGVSFGLNGSTVTGTVATTYRASNDAIGLNTAQSNVTWTVNSAGLSLDARGYAGTGTSATNASITLNSNGLAISVAPGGGGGITNINVSAGTTSNNLSALTFSNSNGITFGLNASTVTASHNGLTAQTVQTQNMVSVQGSTGAISFSNSNGITFGFNASTITASHNGLTSQSNQAYSAANGSATFQTLSFANSNGVSFSTGTQGIFATVQTNYLTTARASNDGVGLATAQTNVTWTVNSAGLSLNAGGYAGTGTSATNASVTLNSNGLAISVAAPGGGGAINVSAGTTSGNLQTLQFDNLNGVSFGLNGSTVTASVAAGGGGGATLSGYIEPIMDREMIAAQVGNNSVFVQPMNVREAISFQSFVFPANFSNATNSSFSATLSVSAGIYTRTGATLSQLSSASGSYAVTASGTVGSYSLYGGVKNYPIAFEGSLSAGNYWMAIGSRTTTGGGAGMTWSQFVVSQFNSAFSGNFGSSNAASNQLVMGLGVYSSTTTQLPTQIPISSIIGTGTVNMRPVVFQLAYSTT